MDTASFLPRYVAAVSLLVSFELTPTTATTIGCNNIPTGVQFGTAVTDLDYVGGWTRCYYEPYSSTLEISELENCNDINNPDLIWFVAAQQTSALDTFYMGAFVNSNDLLNTNNDDLLENVENQATLNSFGVWWYYAVDASESTGFGGSIGFSRDQTIRLYSCDTWK